MVTHIQTEQPAGNGGWRAFMQMIRQTKPPLLILSIALVLSTISTLVGLTIPLFTKNLVNNFSLSSIQSSHVIWMAAAFIAQAIGSAVSIYLLNRSGQQIVATLRNQLWRKLLHVPIPYFDKNQSGEMISRVTSDTAVVKNLITDHVVGLITGIISLVGSIAVLLYLDWRMTLLIVLAIPVCMLILFPLGRIMHRISKGVQEETAKYTSIITRVLSDIRLVKASNAESIEYDQGADGVNKLYRLGLREGKVQALVGPIMYLVMMVMFVAIIGYGGVRVSSGELTSGDLVAFLLYLFQIIMPVSQITQFFTQFQKTVGATERIAVMLDAEEEELHTGLPLPDMHQPITLHQINFGYVENRAVLNKVSFTAEPGKVTAIVGPSGSGKTTLFSLLEQFYRPNSGMIKLGGEDITNYTLRDWRSQIGYVSQESPIIAGTIRDNMTYGIDREVGEEELERAAVMAYADDFIHALADGFNTDVGERGIKLSGGQRQRIAIARAIVRNPSILMLDEATSSLDSTSEMMVQQALTALMQGRTTFVIAHRMSTIVDADQIVFVEHGVVTGTGTHEKLYATHPLYKSFADQQLRHTAAQSAVEV